MWLSEKRLNIIYGTSMKEVLKETPFVEKISRNPHLVPLLIDGSVLTVLNPRSKNRNQHERDKQDFLEALL